MEDKTGEPVFSGLTETEGPDFSSLMTDEGPDFDGMENPMKSVLSQEEMDKRVTSDVLGSLVSLNPVTVKDTWEQRVLEYFKKPMNPAAVKKYFEDEGYLLVPTEMDPAIASVAKSIMSGTEVDPTTKRTLQRRGLTSQLNNYSDYHQQFIDQARLEAMKKPDNPDIVESEPTGEIDENQLLNLVKNAKTRQTAENIIEIYHGQIKNNVAGAHREYQSQWDNPQLEKMNPLQQFGLSFIQAGYSMHAGIKEFADPVFYAPEVAKLREQAEEIKDLPIDRSGAFNFTANTVGNVLPTTLCSVAFGGLASSASLTQASARLYFSLGAALSGYVTEKEFNKEELLSQGVSEAQAEKESNIVGLVNAPLEFLQADTVIDFITAAKRESIKGLSKKVSRSTARKILDAGGKLTKDAFWLFNNEGITEALQEVAPMAVPAYFRGDYLKDKNGKPDWMGMVYRMNEAYIGGGLAGVILGGGGRISTRDDYQRARNDLAASFMAFHNLSEEQAINAATNVIQRQIDGETNLDKIYREEIGPYTQADQKQKAMAHILATEKNIPEADYRQIAVQITGKDSVKDMTFAEAYDFVEALKAVPEYQPAETPKAAEKPKQQTPEEAERALYDTLLEKAQAGDMDAQNQLVDMVQKLHLPTYDDLLERANAGDQAAVDAIQNGEYRVPPKGIEDAVQQVQGEEKGRTESQINEFTVSTVQPDMGAAATEAAPVIRTSEDLINIVKENTMEGGNLARGGDYFTGLMENLQNEELVKFINWSKTQTPFIERFTGGNAASVLRKRGVPVDEIKWQMENTPTVESNIFIRERMPGESKLNPNTEIPSLAPKDGFKIAYKSSGSQGPGYYYTPIEKRQGVNTRAIAEVNKEIENNELYKMVKEEYERIGNLISFSNTYYIHPKDWGEVRDAIEGDKSLQKVFVKAGPNDKAFGIDEWAKNNFVQENMTEEEIRSFHGQLIPGNEGVSSINLFTRAIRTARDIKEGGAGKINEVYLREALRKNDPEAVNLKWLIAKRELRRQGLKPEEIDLAQAAFYNKEYGNDTRPDQESGASGVQSPADVQAVTDEIDRLEREAIQSESQYSDEEINTLLSEAFEPTASEPLQHGEAKQEAAPVTKEPWGVDEISNFMDDSKFHDVILKKSRSISANKDSLKLYDTSTGKVLDTVIKQQGETPYETAKRLLDKNQVMGLGDSVNTERFRQVNPDTAVKQGYVYISRDAKGNIDVGKSGVIYKGTKGRYYIGGSDAIKAKMTITPKGKVEVVSPEKFSELSKSDFSSPSSEAAAKPEAAPVVVYHGKYSGTKTGKGFGGLHVGTKKASEQRLSNIYESEKSRLGPVGAKENLGEPEIKEMQLDVSKIYRAENPIDELASEYKILEIPNSEQRKELVKQGYKGVAYINSTEDSGSTSYLIWDNSAIKSDFSSPSSPGPVASLPGQNLTNQGQDGITAPMTGDKASRDIAPQNNAGGKGEIKVIPQEYDRRGDNVFLQIPVEYVDDGSLNTKIEVGPNGYIKITGRKHGYQPGELKDKVWAAVDSYIESEKAKRYPELVGLWRATNNKSEYQLAKEGTVNPSKDWSIGKTEKGLSVANHLGYAKNNGFKYVYKVNGDIIDYGADGEPVIDISTLKAGKLYSGQSLQLLYKQDVAAEKETMRSIGWTPELKKATGEKIEIVDSESYRNHPQVSFNPSATGQGGEVFTQQEIDALSQKGYSKIDIMKMSVSEGRKLLGVENKPTVSKEAKDKADKLRTLADGLENTIEQKMNPAVSRQNVTARRANMASGMAKEGERIKDVQSALNAIAENIENGTLPQSLDKISTRADVESIMLHSRYIGPYVHNTYIKDALEAIKGKKGSQDIRDRLGYVSYGGNGVEINSESQLKAFEDLISMAEKYGKDLRYAKASLKDGKRLWRLGITDESKFQQARKDLQSIMAPKPKESSNALKIREKVNALIGVKIPGFFPTPKPVIEQMIDKADIKEGMTVLEPSAGKGDIADALKESGTTPDVIEYSPSLQEILRLKGYNVVGEDFLESNQKYDRIIMNPPFENGQDIDHVQHAYELLNPGGKLVSIMSTGPFFRGTKKDIAFREWLDGVGGIVEDMESGSFTGKESFRQTGVSTKLVEINKPVTQAASTQKTDMFGNRIPPTGPTGPQMEFLDKADYKTIQEQERINAQNDIKGQTTFLPPKGSKRGGFIDNTPIGSDVKRIQAARNFQQFIDQKQAENKKGKPVSDKMPDNGLGQEFYDANDTIPGETLSENIKSKGEKLAEGLDKYLGVISSRIINISKRLFYDKIQKYDFDLKQQLTRYHKTRNNFERAIKGMSKKDRVYMEYARWNASDADVEYLCNKYGVSDLYRQYRAVEDEIFFNGKEVGYDIHYLEGHFARSIKPGQIEALLKYLESDQRGLGIQKMLEERAAKLGYESAASLPDEERGRIINIALRGYTSGQVNLAAPGWTKTRTLPVIDKNIAKFFEPMSKSISDYIDRMTTNIAARKFFGRQSKEMVKLRNEINRLEKSLNGLHQKHRALSIGQQTNPTLFPDTEKTKLDKQIQETQFNLEQAEKEYHEQQTVKIEDTVGGWLDDQMAEGFDFTPDQQKALKNMLSGYFQPVGPGPVVSAAITYGHIEKLSQFTNIITQVGEIVFSLRESLFRTVPNWLNANFARSNIKLDDIGIENIGQEFIDDKIMQKARNVLLTGMTWADRVNKETFINTVYDKYVALAKSNNPKAQAKLQTYFGDNTQGVLNDLKSGKVTDDIKYFLFCELAEVQPISKLEVPEGYLKAGNGRLLYTLQTFSIKRLDIIRRQAYNLIRDGIKDDDKKKVLKGIGKLIYLALIFVLSDSSTDAVKDLIRGKDIVLDQTVQDNMWNLILFNKYSMDKALRGKPTEEILSEYAPSFPSIDRLYEDFWNINDPASQKYLESTRSIPLVGEAYYWWFGEGRRKIDTGYYERLQNKRLQEQYK